MLSLIEVLIAAFLLAIFAVTARPLFDNPPPTAQVNLGTNKRIMSSGVDNSRGWFICTDGHTMEFWVQNYNKQLVREIQITYEPDQKSIENK